MVENNTQILFSLFTRDNPNGDSVIYEGCGPMKRTVERNAPKLPNGHWNTIVGSRAKDLPLMPNPDEIIETFTLPAENNEFNLFDIAKTRPLGNKWLEACERYLTAWKGKLPSEFPFKMELSKMPVLYYVEEIGYFRTSYERDKCFGFAELPEKMLFGIFRPLAFDRPWTHDPNKIGMHLNGGAISPNNQKWGYRAQTSKSDSGFFLPFSHQLFGDLSIKDLTETKFCLYDGDFPRTHFVEYVFSKHCPGEEKALCPGIRIEIMPKSLEDMTLAREKKWAKKTREAYDKSFCDCCGRRY
jgi:hypothetical protein